MVQSLLKNIVFHFFVQTVRMCFSKRIGSTQVISTRLCKSSLAKQVNLELPIGEQIVQQ